MFVCITNEHSFQAGRTNEFYSFQLYAHRQLLLFGNGAAKTKELFEGLDYIYYLDNVELRASSLGLLAQEDYEQEKWSDLAYYEPNYFKAFKAIKPKSLI